VRCGVGDTSWTRAIAHEKRPNVNLAPFVSAAKLAVVDQLVRFFAVHGAKVMVFTESKFEFGILNELYGRCAVCLTGDAKNREADIAAFRKRPSAEHRALWCSTSICTTGSDFADLVVVIMLHANTSPSQIRQKAGRCARKLTQRCYVFDVLDVDENEWVATAPSGKAIANVTKRYDRFIEDGYDEELQVVDAEDLIVQLNTYMNDVGVVYNGNRLDGATDTSCVLTSPFDDATGDVALVHLILLLWHMATGTADVSYKSIFGSRKQQQQHKKATSSGSTSRFTNAAAALSGRVRKPPKKKKVEEPTKTVCTVPSEWTATTKKHADAKPLFEVVADALERAGKPRPEGGAETFKSFLELRESVKKVWSEHEAALEAVRFPLLSVVDKIHDSITKAGLRSPPVVGNELRVFF
jgi:superfamily II DNA/RNA helicase